MIKSVDLLAYLPPFMQEYEEIKAAFEAENSEFKAIWSAVEEAFLNSCLLTATESGVERREKLLNIQPKVGESLEERKFTVLTRLNRRAPCTEKMLREQLKTLCGEGNYAVEVDCENNTVSVLVGLAAKNSFNDVADLLESSVPANMIINLGLKYNRHSMFETKTNGELKPYTHSQLRNEVLTNGRIYKQL